MRIPAKRESAIMHSEEQQVNCLTGNRPVRVGARYTFIFLSLLGMTLLGASLPAQQFDRGQEPPPLPPAESARAFTATTEISKRSTNPAHRLTGCDQGRTALPPCPQKGGDHRLYGEYGCETQI